MRDLFSNVHRAVSVCGTSPAVLLAVVAALLAAGPVTTASGGGITLATPSGLNPGDKFRFVYVTSGSLQPDSSDIETYNTFVNTQAYDANYADGTVLWKAIASTPTVNARDNVGGFGTSIPVYLVDGTRVANDLTTSTGGFWSGDLFAAINISIDGTGIYDDTWTGSNDDGTGNASYTLGQYYSTVGNANTSSGFLNYGNAFDTAYNYMFAMSSDLTVPVPEIDPGGMGSVLALIGGSLGLLERRRKRA
jgi:hypothetical protein